MRRFLRRTTLNTTSFFRVSFRKKRKLFSTEDSKRITELEEKHIIKHQNIIEYQINSYNANHPTEDAHSIVIDDDKQAFFLCCDGHGGPTAAKFARQYLIPYCKYFLQKNFENQRALLAERPDLQVLKNLDSKQWENGNEQLKQLRQYLDASYAIPRGIISAFQKCDSDFLRGCVLEVNGLTFQDGLSGACVTLAYIANNTLYVANAGDCRVILGRRGKNDKMEAIQLSREFTADSEAQRLQKEHPNESDVVVDGRVKGILIPSRGIGDGLFKLEVYNNAHDPPIFEKTNYSPPYTTPIPEVNIYEITEEDEFIVMGTDGLFDDLTNEEIVNLVNTKKETEDNIATLLIHKALLKAYEVTFEDKKKRNDEEKLNILVNLPNPFKRHVHDDITVIVIFLKKSKTPQEKFLPQKDANLPKICTEIYLKAQTLYKK